MRNSYEKYRDRKLAYQKEYRAKNGELLKEADRKRYESDRAYFEAKRRARKQRITDLTVFPFTDEEITQTHGAICYLCETPVDVNLEPGWSTSPQRDHVHPISHPDTPGHVIENVKWTHARCNIVKGDRMLDELDLPFSPPEEIKY